MDGHQHTDDTAGDTADHTAGEVAIHCEVPGRSEVPDPREVVVVAGGTLPLRAVRGHLPAGATVVAADSGWDCARHLGLMPHLLVGDLDSISAGGLAEARRTGVPIEEHPADKDATDTELALVRAADMLAAHRGVARLTVVAGGDRLDHLLGVIAALADPRWDTVRVQGYVGAARLHRVGPLADVDIPTAAESTVSLVALGGGAEGVVTRGLRWSLAGERLDPWRSRGLSNVAIDDTVSVGVSTGALVVIEPGFLAADATASSIHQTGDQQ